MPCFGVARPRVRPSECVLGCERAGLALARANAFFHRLSDMADDAHDDDVDVEQIGLSGSSAMAAGALRGSRAHRRARLVRATAIPQPPRSARVSDRRGLSDKRALEERNDFGVSAVILLGPDDRAKVTKRFRVVRVESERAMQDARTRAENTRRAFPAHTALSRARRCRARRAHWDRRGQGRARDRAQRSRRESCDRAAR